MYEQHVRNQKTKDKRSLSTDLFQEGARAHEFKGL